MPEGKPAGVRCIHLATDYRCALFGRSDRPSVCEKLIPMPDTCGETRDEAMVLIQTLEQATTPEGPQILRVN